MNKESIRVAIADDNRCFVSIIEEFLNEQDDIEVVGVAYDGEEILDLIAKKEPDVVILDIIMPHLDGIGVLEKLNITPELKRPKIIMLSAIGKEITTQKVVELGADYYILKPFQNDMIVSRIKLAGQPRGQGGADVCSASASPAQACAKAMCTM